eukprot:Gb_39753 [translate_table: standard]
MDPYLNAAVDMLKREVMAIIGPQKSEVAEFVAQLGDAAQVPIISFSATNPLLSMHRYPYFVRMARNDSLQMQSIAELVKAYGWRRVVAIYPDDDFGTGAISSLNDALVAVGSEIEYRSTISPTADRQTISEELYKLMPMQSRVFIVHMHYALGSNLFMVAKQIGMMETDYVWIITDGFTSLLDVCNASVISSMQGVLGVRTYIKETKNLDDFTTRWKRQFRLDNPHEDKAEINLYGLFAYDTIFLIGRAIGNLLSKEPNMRFNFLRNSKNIENASNLTDIKVFQEGPKLLQEIHNTKFSGISGPVQIQDGEIMGSAYEIVNVIGKSYRAVGYWSSYSNGLSKQVPFDNESAYSNHINANPNSSANLGTVIWPGGSTAEPRGWVIPTSGKRLRIGVPAKNGFNQFVTVSFDRVRNVSHVEGFCKDVFDAVLKRLDYALPYDLIPYPNGNVTPSRDDLVYQVYLKNFDAVVGDITILANRSKYVDFTQPYTESGLAMVVPIKTDEANNAWAFMLPFTPGMWCATGTLFIFTGVVVWLLEHKKNPVFRGNPRSQVVTLLWFSFSTLFFAHRERIVSSLARMVTIIWLFVVLILMSSYTASLTSILTVQQMKPTIEDVSYLKAAGVVVGYKDGSFVGDYIHEMFGIEKRKLKPLSTSEDYAGALSNGSVAAIFDEIPYIRVFLSTHCGYTMAGPTYRTGGFGFVFPKGSPLVPDMSRAVLSLSEDKEMQGIQSKWFNNNTACTNPGGKVVPNRLSMESFWGLFLITGTASIVALILCFSRLLYNFIRDPKAVEETQGNPSIGKSLKSFAKYVDRRERKRSRSNSPCSTPVFSPSPPNHGNASPFSTASSSLSISSRSFSFHEQHAPGGAIHREDDSRNVSARYKTKLLASDYQGHNSKWFTDTAINTLTANGLLCKEPSDARLEPLRELVGMKKEVIGPPLFHNPWVIVLLDAKSFLTLFDMKKVEKKNVFTGAFDDVIAHMTFNFMFKIIMDRDPIASSEASLQNEGPLHIKKWLGLQLALIQSTGVLRKCWRSSLSIRVNKCAAFVN